MKLDRMVRLAAVAVVAALSLKLAHELNTRPVAGHQWPEPSTLDSLRPFLKSSEVKRHEIDSFGYRELSAYDPFAREEQNIDPEPVQPVPRVSAPARSAERLSVSAILITGDSKVAVINNALVRVGSTLPDGTRIVGIGRDYVQIVSREGAPSLLRLNQGG